MFVKVVAVGLVCVLGASVTLAHSKIAKSVPGEGVTVKAGLSEITLGFSKPVRLMLVKVRKTRFKEDVSPKFSPAANFGTSYSFKVPALAAGSYKVNWTAVAKDGHVMRGTLSFKVSD